MFPSCILYKNMGKWVKGTLTLWSGFGSFQGLYPQDLRSYTLLWRGISES
jgi:hypothetical protein